MDCQSESDREPGEKDQKFEMIPSLILPEEKSEISINSFQIPWVKISSGFF